MKEKLGYASGDMASCLYFGVFMYFLQIFYTDVFGLAPAVVGTMILVTRTWDWINDPIMGMIADRTKSRHGRFRPWLLWVLPFWVVLGILCFTTFDLGTTGKLVYAYVTYTLLMMAYTAINVPYSALMGVMSPRSDQRTLLNSFRFLGAFIGTTTIAWTFLPLVKLFGGGDDQRGYSLAMTLFGILSAGLFIATFVTTKERIQPPKSQKSNLGKDLSMALRNGPWRAIFLIGMLTVLWTAVRVGSTAHFFKYVSGQELWASWLLGIGGAIQAVAVLFTKQITQWFRCKKNTYIGLTLINAAFLAAFYFIPPEHFPLLAAHQLLSSCLSAPLMPLFWSMLADTADYGQWKLGHRTTGLLLSTGTSSMKIGWSIGPALGLYLLSYYGFVANVEQTAETKAGLTLIMSFIPAGLAVIAAAAGLLYKIDGKMELEMEAAIAQQREDAPDHC